WTVVYVDLPALLDAGELRALTKPSEFYDTYQRRMAALLADQLLVTLDDKALTLRCVEQRYEVLDHLRCEYIFVADWSLAPGGEHRLEVHDTSYDREPGRVKLGLSEDATVNVLRRTVPSSILQGRAPTDLRPGDDDRLRTLR